MKPIIPIALLTGLSGFSLDMFIATLGTHRSLIVVLVWFATSVISISVALLWAIQLVDRKRRMYETSDYPVRIVRLSRPGGRGSGAPEVSRTHEDFSEKYSKSKQ